MLKIDQTISKTSSHQSQRHWRKCQAVAIAVSTVDYELPSCSRRWTLCDFPTECWSHQASWLDMLRTVSMPLPLRKEKRRERDRERKRDRMRERETERGVSCTGAVCFTPWQFFPRQLMAARFSALYSPHWITFKDYFFAGIWHKLGAKCARVDAKTNSINMIFFSPQNLQLIY